MLRSLQCLVLLISMIQCASVENAFAFQEEIDWIWNDTKPTAQRWTGMYEIYCEGLPYQDFPKKRVRKTCLQNSIESYRKGDQEEALGWILAGQCHDRLARETIVRHAPKVLEFVLQQYGNELLTQ